MVEDLYYQLCRKSILKNICSVCNRVSKDCIVSNISSDICIVSNASIVGNVSMLMCH